MKSQPPNRAALDRLRQILDGFVEDAPMREEAAAILDYLEVLQDEQDLANEDAREQGRALRKLQKLHARGFDALALPLLMLDDGLRVVSANAAASAELNLPPKITVPRDAFLGRLSYDMRTTLVGALEVLDAGQAYCVDNLRLSQSALTGAEEPFFSSYRAHCLRLPPGLESAFLVVLEQRDAGVFLKRQVAVLKGLLEASDLLTFATNADHELLYYNRFLEKFAATGSKLQIGQKLSDALPLPQAAQHMQTQNTTLKAAQGSIFTEERFETSTGRRFIFQTRKVPLYDELNQFLGMGTVSRDISEDAERERARSLGQRIYQQASDAIVVLDRKLRIEEANPAFENLLGLSKESVIGKSFSATVFRTTAPGKTEHILYNLQAYYRWNGELVFQNAVGDDVLVWCNITAMRDENEHVTGYLVIHTDLTRIQSAEKANAKLAYFDSLTGLPNRANLLNELEAHLERARLYEQSFGVAFLDLDRFKAINDSLGHSTGDALLRIISKRLTACAGDRDLVARLGGDEFVLLLPDLTFENWQESVARYADAIKVPARVGTLAQYHPTGSFGVALYPWHGSNPDELLSNADIAMYQSKSRGRDKITLFTGQLAETALYQFEVQQSLEHALSAGEMELHYQPIFDLGKRATRGVEALVRWNRPGHGIVSPGLFMSGLELSGLLKPLDQWVLDRAIRDLATWVERFDLPPDWIMSVNQTSHDISDPGWLSYLTTLLERYAAPGPMFALGQHLQIELTEDALAETSATVLRNLDALSTLGVSLAIDDFGTGYSNMSYLQALPVSTLKIDGSFIQRLGETKDAKVLPQAMISISRQLGLKTVAERVETPEQEAVLIDMGCQYGQGFLVSPALPASTFEKQFLQGIAPDIVQSR